MDYEDGVEVISKAIEKQSERQAWEIWLTMLPHTEPDQRKDFSEFYQSIKSNPNSVELSTEDIIAEMELVKAKHQGKK